MQDPLWETACLECGCFILDGRVEFFCSYHWYNQPIINDALDSFLTERNRGYCNDAADRSQQALD